MVIAIDGILTGLRTSGNKGKRENFITASDMQQLSKNLLVLFLIFIGIWLQKHMLKIWA